MRLIFNTSMPRSGSELLQVILHQNPKIYGSATSPLLEYQFAVRSQLNLAEVRSQNQELMINAFDSVCSGIANSYYKAITDRPVVIDKSRGWMHYEEWVERWNPNPKMICMVRDLRDIAASFERIFRANRHLPDSIDIPAEMKNITTEQRVSHWLNTQPVGLALQRLYDVFNRDLAKNILFVRYEDLCYDPKDTIKMVYDYLEEEPFNHDFNNLVKEVEEDDSYFGVYGSHKVSKQIKPNSQKWESVLSPQTGANIKNSNKWYFDQFSY